MPSGSESGTTTLRNLGLFIAALFALILALWRGIIANHQAEAAQEQVEIARLELMNERYQKGAEMLGNDTLYQSVSAASTGLHAWPVGTQKSITF